MQNKSYILHHNVCESKGSRKFCTNLSNSSTNMGVFFLGGRGAAGCQFLPFASKLPFSAILDLEPPHFRLQIMFSGHVREILNTLEADPPFPKSCTHTPVQKCHNSVKVKLRNKRISNLTIRINNISHHLHSWVIQ